MRGVVGWEKEAQGPSGGLGGTELQTHDLMIPSESNAWLGYFWTGSLPHSRAGRIPKPRGTAAPPVARRCRHGLPGASGHSSVLIDINNQSSGRVLRRRLAHFGQKQAGRSTHGTMAHTPTQRAQGKLPPGAASPGEVMPMGIECRGKRSRERARPVRTQETFANTAPCTTHHTTKQR